MCVCVCAVVKYKRPPWRMGQGTQGNWALQNTVGQCAWLKAAWLFCFSLFGEKKVGLHLFPVVLFLHLLLFNFYTIEKKLYGPYIYIYIWL